MRLRSLLALLALLLPSVACDQATKALAVAHLKGAGRIHVVDSLFTLVYAENPGAFLGLGRSLPDRWRWLVFTVAVAIVLGGVAVVMLRRKLAPMAFVGVALLVSGGVGNLVDRVARPGGRVVDFAQLGLPASIGGLRVQTGVFNVADVQIMGGAALMLLSTWRRRKDDEDEPAAAVPPPATPTTP
jgi:signal peptidase II